MKKIFYLALLLIACQCTAYAQEGTVIAQQPTVVTGQLIRVTEPLSEIKPVSSLQRGDIPVRDENGVIWSNVRPKPEARVPQKFPEQNNVTDAVMQKSYNELNSSNPSIEAATIGANFNGIGFSSVNPPDPSLCVGPNHIIQMINGSGGALFKVYNKTGGQVVAQTFLDAVTGKGGLGDPIALYDQLADRYVLTEFANASQNGGNDGLIFAVSQTNDPAGRWYVYFFSTGTVFPDYPKFSVWPDAYYATSNDFAPGYTGSTAFAFDRAKMLAGNTTATMQRFSLGRTDKSFSSCPVLWQGTTAPPAGTGGLIAYMFDDASTSSTADKDSIGLLEFDVDFANPSASRLSARASLAVSSVNQDLCNASRRTCITQAGSSSNLEDLSGRIMNQPIYRNFAGNEGIVLAHTANAGNGVAGVRWYELRKPSGGNWAVNQQSTYSPDATNRWMPGICYDKFGNIGLAYNVASNANNVFPGIRFTGRKACDPLNSMTYPEQTIVAGTAANGSTRYGDYNHLVADADGGTLWFTAEWNGARSWSTRVASFTLDQCNPSACGDPSGLSSSNITSTGATVSWTTVSGATNYTVEYKLSTATAWITAAAAATGTSVNLTGLTQNSTYDWRVKANCSNGASNFVAAKFTTTGTIITGCAAPTNLAVSAISTSGATVSWAAVTGATSYDVDYKLVTDTAWTSAVKGTTSTSTSLTGLKAASAYNWRVKANCANASSNFAVSQLVTATVTGGGCPGVYDTTANGSFANAQMIPMGTDVKGLISTSTDNDYFKFTITTEGRYSITLKTVPADFDIRLFNSNGQRIGISQRPNTQDEIITRTLPAGTYVIRVYGWRGANSATVCYTLKVEKAANGARETGNDEITDKENIKIYPTPAKETLNVYISGFTTRADISVFDMDGKLLMRRQATAANTALKINTLASGVYILKVEDSNGTQYQSRFVKQ